MEKNKQKQATRNTWLIWWFFLLSNVSFLEHDSISGVVPPSLPVKRPGKFGNSVRLWFVIDPEVPLTGWTHKSARGWNVMECLQANVQGQADRLIKVNEFLKIIRGAPKAWDSQVTTHLYWIGWFLGVFHGFGNVLLTWLASQRRRRSISKSARSSLCVPVRRASWPPWLVSPIGQPWLT